MRWYYWLATIAWCLILFWLSNQPVPPGPKLDLPGLDKLQHLVAYGILTAIVSFGMRSVHPGHSERAQFWAPILAACAYGVFDELHQTFIPLRHFDPLDLLADAAAAVFVQAYLCARRWKLSYGSSREATPSRAGQDSPPSTTESPPAASAP